MTEQTNREVCVLATFHGDDGVEHQRGEVFSVTYQTQRQRQYINQMIYRGFLTFDLASAKDVVAPKEPLTLENAKPAPKEG
jgi:hypothetical protein